MAERRAIKDDISDVHVVVTGVGKCECQRFAATAGNLAEIEQRAVCAKPARQHTLAGAVHHRHNHYVGAEGFQRRSSPGVPVAIQGGAFGKRFGRSTIL